MRQVIFGLISLCFSGVAFGQGEDNSLKGTPFKERIVTGGGFGLSFSSYQDFFSLSPQVGYMVTRKFMAGTGFTYRYTKYKDYSPAITFNDWAINPFLRYTVFRNIFIQTEYEYLNYEDLAYPVTAARETVRRNFSSFLAGGGFFQPVGQKVALYITALYNFAYRDPNPGEYYPYSSPLVIRAGVTIGNANINSVGF